MFSRFRGQLERRLLSMVGSVGVAAASLAPTGAHAAVGGGGGGGAMPWLTPLQNFANALSGPTAGYIAIIGVFVCAAMLIWGGEMSEFGRRVVMVILAIAILLGVNVFIQATFTGGALLGYAPISSWVA